MTHSKYTAMEKNLVGSLNGLDWKEDFFFTKVYKVGKLKKILTTDNLNSDAHINKVLIPNCTK